MLVGRGVKNEHQRQARASIIDVIWRRAGTAETSHAPDYGVILSFSAFHVRMESIHTKPARHILVYVWSRRQHVPCGLWMNREQTCPSPGNPHGWG